MSGAAADEHDPMVASVPKRPGAGAPPRPPAPDRLAVPLVAGAALAVMVAVAFAPIFSAAWASADDYTFLANALEGKSALSLVLRDGRPVLGALYDLASMLVDSSRDLVVFRAIYVLLLTASVLGLVGVLQTIGFRRSTAMLTAGLFGLGVPHIDLAALSPGFVVPVGYALAMSAFVLARRSGWRARAWSSALLVAAFCTYTVAGFLFVALVGLACLLADDLRPALRRALTGLVLFGASAVAYGLVFLVIVPRVLGLATSDRASLTTSPALKVASVIALPMRDAFDLFVFFPHDFVWAAHRGAAHGQADLMRFARDAAVDPAVWLASASALLFCLALLLRPATRGGDRWLRLGAGLVFLPMCFGSNLLLQSMWSPFRTQVALGLLITGILASGLSQVVASDRSSGRRWLLHVVIGVLFAAATIQCRSVVRAFVVEPLRCEREALLSGVAAIGERAVVSVLPPAEGTTAAPAIRYELGRQAAAAPWAPEPMIRVARHELGLSPPEQVLVLSGPAAPGAATALPLGCPAAR